MLELEKLSGIVCLLSEELQGKSARFKEVDAVQ